ncbi:hypothetical protein AG1IA_08729 [Rhizoctonia solani AG-1 IA]|uniref:Uncharacterized protein n=1 Tax=Thanatephorus cucumeris (strain AG1-IA) TaxID=983506 RepID=L8WH46_THACA|nr:hypothetical protein AG1IA_08729 [Rhizoctonia solani AG-1 IA]
MGIEAESQIWHVVLTNTGLPSDFQLDHNCRLPHSNFVGNIGIVGNYRMTLPNRSCPRALSKLSDGSPVSLYEDIHHARQEEYSMGLIPLPTEQHMYSFPIQGLAVNMGLGSHIPLALPPLLPPGLINDNIASRFPQEPSSNQEVLASVMFTDFQPSSRQSPQAPPASVLATEVETGIVSPVIVGMLMEVGDTPPSEEQVAEFTRSFRKDGVGKGATMIICLHCPQGSGKSFMPDLRPWHLKVRYLGNGRNLLLIPCAATFNESFPERKVAINKRVLACG